MHQLQLIIPEPCHQNWQEMTTNDQGRFCNSCAKTVIDFSAMTDTQLLKYFANLSGENICGRVHPDQLTRTISTLPESGRKRFGYWQYALTLLLFFSKGQQARAQGGIVINAKKSNQHKTAMEITPETTLPHTKRFQVTDEQGVPVAGANVQMVSSGKYFVADTLGYVSLGKEFFNEQIIISSAGFQKNVIRVSTIKDVSVKLIPDRLVLEEVKVIAGSTLGAVRHITMGSMAYSVAKTLTLKDSLQNIINYVTPSISVYPNPVARGGLLNLSVKLKKEGRFTVHIIDASGKLMLAQNYIATGKKAIQQIGTGAGWSSGIYFLLVTGDDGKRIGKEKVMIK